jgi:hypothetical protein
MLNRGVWKGINFSEGVARRNEKELALPLRAARCNLFSAICGP